ncbi:MAG: hypothetical protein J6K17_07880 [Oscillospiraceae bacterium]|nr:hypothetical protein [Oscillospiraceae bacterium]
MNNTKKILSGVLALSLTAGFTACGSKSSDTGADTAQTTAQTTTAITVETNTATLAAEEVDVLAGAMDKLQDVELANKEIKWLAHYDLNPSGSGASKSVAQEMFERKYGGTITWYKTVWENRYTDLSTYVLGGEGIDFFPGDDVYNFPKGIISGMFLPIDDYIDMDSEIWADMKPAMDLYNFGGKHFNLVTSVTAEEICIYNKATIEANGLDDPWELFEAGEWNWDTFKGMLQEFVDDENDQFGLDGYWAENALLFSAGVPLVGTKDGQLVCNYNDATVEKAMNFQYDLFNAGLVFDRTAYSGANQEIPEMMGDGRQLFYIVGAYSIQADPATWVTKIDPADVGIVPVPSPADSDPYAVAKLNGYAICKGAQNPQGVALFAECNVVGSTDEGAVAISDRKTMDDFKWSEELLEKNKMINELAMQYPVVDLASGCSTDVASYTTQGGDNVGTRAALHGADWATTRETYADAVIGLVDEVNAELQTKIAELG